MIYVDRIRLKEPQVLKDDNANSNGEKNRAIRFIENKQGEPVEFNIYRKEEVKGTLKSLFYDKCAYCESKVTHISYPHIEHWRPKKAVYEDKNHPGYYWLASEWDNLLLACSICNSQRYKGNKFPIEVTSKYATKSNHSITMETPLLINPCLEDPEYHLEYTDLGAIIGHTIKGKTSVNIYGLDRIELTLERRKFSDIVKRRLNEILKMIDQASIMIMQNEPESRFKWIIDMVDGGIKELETFTSPSFQYSGMSKFIIRKYRNENKLNEIFIKKTESLII